MSKNTTLLQKLRYYFDNTLASGSSAIMAWLAVVSVLLVILFGAVYSITGINQPDSAGMGFLEAMWQALMRSVDSGAVAGDVGWAFRLVGLLVTIGGIFILSTLIGVLTAGLESKLEALRKGRSEVLESGHTLILGWSDKIFYVINELVVANANQPKPRIVILAPRDKVEMEDELRDKVPERGKTRIICRTGNPFDLDDIRIANPDEAKSIIILAGGAENPDTYVIKSVMALTNNPARKATPYHIVAEIDDDENLEAAQLAGQGEAIFVRTSSIMARMAAQTCRQSGLSVIYSDLLDYQGDEIYFQSEPALLGQTYQDVLFCYPQSTVIGIEYAADGRIELNPPMLTCFSTGDRLVAITRDDDTLQWQAPQDDGVDRTLILPATTPPPQPETNVMLGWNPKGERIIRELDQYVAAGSSLLLISAAAGLDEQIAALQLTLQHQTIRLVSGNITRRVVLEQIDLAASRNIIVLSATELPVQEADANTLITLLHLRNLAEKSAVEVNIVSEMGDSKNRALAAVARANDFIISDNLISLMLSQLSETRELQRVFDTLFSSEGAEIYLKPACDYVRAALPLNFYTLLTAAAERGETAIGYRLMAHKHDAAANFGICLNPNKAERFTLAADDRVIVLANS